MYCNILKTCLILGFFLEALSQENWPFSFNLTEDLSDYFKVSPFTQVGDKLYYFSQIQVNWFKAALDCRKLDGFLASLKTKEELDEIRQYVKSKYPSVNSWWLSGSDLQAKGEYSWYGTGELIKGGDWRATQPDNHQGLEHCVHLYNYGPIYQLNDWNCNRTSNYICEAYSQKIVTFTLE